MNLDETLRTVEQINERANKLAYYFPHRNDTREYVVNVKRHHDAVDLDEAIAQVEAESPKLSEAAKEWLHQKMDLNMAWCSWVEVERAYVTGSLFKGLTLSSDGYWEQRIKQVQAGQDIGFSILRNLKTTQERVKKVEEWWQNDRTDRRRLDLMSNLTPGWVGKQGGYFTLFGAHEQLTEYYDNLKELLGEPEEEIDEFELQEQLEGYRELADAVLWFMKVVEEYNEGMDFMHEVKVRIDDELDDAKHHGVLLYQNGVEQRERLRKERAARQRSILSEVEKAKWDLDLHRFDDEDGHLISLLVYPNGTPGTYGESEVYLIELPVEHFQEFREFLQEKFDQCLKEDERRDQQAAEDDATMEGYGI